MMMNYGTPSKDFWRFLPAVFVDEMKAETNPWYQVSMAIDDFNEICRSRVVCSWVVVVLGGQEQQL
jgi:hypothetical protein